MNPWGEQGPSLLGNWALSLSPQVPEPDQPLIGEGELFLTSPIPGYLPIACGVKPGSKAVFRKEYECPNNRLR